MSPPPKTSWIILALIVLLGGTVRLYDLGHRPIGHVESYTPGIEFPEGVSAPAPRVDFRAAVRGSLDEVHPPVWYALSWPWTRFVGTDLAAMRLSSAILGTLAVLLAYIVGAGSRGRLTGLIAAAFIAGHGHFVFWSQMSRPSILGCVLSLATTALLQRFLASERRGRALLCLYLVLTLAGLGNSYYYWTLFGAQLLWIWMSLGDAKDRLLGFYRWASLTFVAATPIVSLAAYQSVDRDNYLETDRLATLAELVGLCFPFHRVHDDPHTPFITWTVVRFLPVLGAVFLLAGLTLRRQSKAASEAKGPGSPPTWTVVFTTFGATGLIAAVAYALSRIDRLADRSSSVGITAVVPLVVGTLLIIETRTGFLSRLPGRIGLRGRSPGLIPFLALTPAIVVFAVDAVMPFLAPRHMLVFTPYLLMVVATGVERVILGAKGAARTGLIVVCAAVFLTTLAASTEYVRHRTASATDYAQAADFLLDDLREDDLVFMARHWVNTPILYYLRHLDREWLWRDWPKAVAKRPRARIWVVRFEGVPEQRLMEKALTDHEKTRSESFKNVTVEIWERR